MASIVVCPLRSRQAASVGGSFIYGGIKGNGPSVGGKLRPLTEPPTEGVVGSDREPLALDTAKRRRVQAACPSIVPATSLDREYPNSQDHGQGGQSADCPARRVNRAIRFWPIDHRVVPMRHDRLLSFP